MGDGHLNKCKECTKKDVKEHRQLNLERIRQYDKVRASMPHRIALRRRVMDEYVSAHPERKIATDAVRYAVRSGKLTRLPCEICGSKALAHHPAYDKPLLVTWLCQPHHKAAHAIK